MCASRWRTVPAQPLWDGLKETCLVEPKVFGYESSRNRGSPGTGRQFFPFEQRHDFWWTPVWVEVRIDREGGSTRSVPPASSNRAANNSKSNFPEELASV